MKRWTALALAAVVLGCAGYAARDQARKEGRVQAINAKYAALRAAETPRERLRRMGIRPDTPCCRRAALLRELNGARCLDRAPWTAARKQRLIELWRRERLRRRQEPEPERRPVVRAIPLQARR